ncbi:DUF547 domain-containing protein [Cytophagaceae bacterium ABcell3]|nr:DUF547 domain-containing protein [Cytophagaceae bacterium ABcell3]
MEKFQIGVLVFFLWIVSVVPADAQKFQRKFFRKSNKFFKEYVSEGKVDYARVKKKPHKLDDLLQLIEKANLSRSPEPVLKAFYLNAHNVLVISGVVKNYPVSSPYDIEGFFTNKDFKVSGQTLSLQELKHDIILSKFSDKKLYFGLSTGTSGFFPAPEEAFFPKTLDKQLKQCLRNAVNDEKFVRVKKNSGTVLLSESLMMWKQAVDKKDIIKFINEHRNEEIPDSYKIVWYPASHILNK